VEKINKTEEVRCVENLRNDVVTLGWKSYTSNANDAGDTNKVLIEHDDVDDYLKNLRWPFTWGGSSELKLIANILNVVLIVVLEKGHIVYKPPDEFPKLVAAISYNGRNHYDPYVPHQLIKEDLYACEDISCNTITVPFHKVFIPVLNVQHNCMAFVGSLTQARTMRCAVCAASAVCYLQTTLKTILLRLQLCSGYPMLLPKRLSLHSQELQQLLRLHFLFKFSSTNLCPKF
jgi:hypothetical protein